jgi:hypothetical protein
VAVPDRCEPFAEEGHDGFDLRGRKYPIHANAEKFIKVGEWNAFKIECKGDHYRIWLNGEKVVDADLPGFNAPGPIGLQIHAGLKMKVEFKDLKAAELK